MATYSAQCSAIGSFNYANYFKLYVVLTETNVSIENNTSQIEYNVYCQSSGSGSISANHLKYFNLNGTDIINTTEKVNVSSPNAYIAIASGRTGAISHNDDGSKSVSFSAQIKASSYGVSASLSGTFTLTTIARASSVTCSTANIGSNPTISISRKNNSFTHTITYVFGSLSGTIATKTTSTSITSWTLPDSFYAQIPNDKQGIGTIRCYTYNGDTLIKTSSGADYSTCTFYANTVESVCKPTVTATLTDINSTTANLIAGTPTVENKLIKYKSTARLVIKTTLNKNAGSIKSVTVNGINIGTNTSITKDYTNVNATKFEIIVTDVRGYFTTYTFSESNGNLTIIDYVPLTLSTNFFRPQPTTGAVQLTYSGNYFNGSFGSVANNLSITWKYKASTDSSYTTGGTITPTISNNKISETTISLGTNFDYQTAYDFQLVAVDKLASVTRNVQVSKGMPVFYWGKDFFDVEGTLKIKGNNIIDILYPIGSVYMSVSNTNPATLFGGTWTQISGRFLYCTTTSKTTGGSTTTGSTTLTTSQIPSHTHLVGIGNAGTNYVYWGDSLPRASTTGWAYGYQTSVVPNTLYAKSSGGGEGHTHNQNLPPYFTVYCWYRTA